MNVSVRQKNWDDLAERLVKKLNPVVGVDVIRDSVNSKRVALYEVKADGFVLGIFLARVDILENGERQLVIMHAIAEYNVKQSLTSVLNPFFDEIARGHKIKSIRIHSERPGMDKVLKKNGYKFSESVFIKNLED